MQPRDDRRPAPRVSLGTRQLVTFLRAKSAKNGYCWWKQETIARDMERGLRTVNRQIAEAVAAGLLRSERHGHGNHYTPCDLVEKVAYRDAAAENTVENPVRPADVGASDTPNWRNGPPPVFITEPLKPEKKNQSECVVQEHQEQAGAVTEPSPYEKAQADAIASAVRACGFEPTPDLIAKLERKRCHYAVTGFVVASAIGRAFKLVQDTSNRPQRLAWFTAVVENALKSKRGPDGSEQHGAAGEMPTVRRPKWTPAPPAPATQNQPGPIPEDVANVDQVRSSISATAAANTQAIEHVHQRPPATIAVTGRELELSVEDRRLLAELRKTYRFATRENLMEAMVEMRAAGLRTVEESAAAVHPRPPQSERGALAQAPAAAALRGLG